MNPDLARLRHEDPDEFARKLAEDMLIQDSTMKVETCADGPDDLPNRVVYIAEAVDAVNLVMPMGIGGEPIHPVDEINLCVSMGREQFGEPFLVGHLAEGYMQFFAEGEAHLAPTERGVLSQRFAEGDPKVRECLMVLLIHRRKDRSLRTLGGRLPYSYDGNTVTFGDAQWTDSLIEGDSSGTIPDALAAAFGSEQN